MKSSLRLFLDTLFYDSQDMQIIQKLEGTWWEVVTMQVYHSALLL
jgi:hypothetical protein